MRLNFTLFFLLLISFTADAQKLTGIWRGYFSSSNGISRETTREETYKYEIQIDQQSNNGLKGVTYSYKSTIFYGKAELSGIFTAASRSLILKEIKMLELKIGDKSEPCLMTCYLDYTKMGKMEILEGTFVSYNLKDKGDCGSGKVYLERVTTSEFKKEDFLIKKKPDDSVKEKPKPPVITKTDKPKPVFGQPATPQTRKNNLVTKPIPLQPSTTPKRDPVTGGTIKITPPPVKKPVQKPIAGKPKSAIKEDKPTVTARAERIPEESVNSKKEETVTTIPQFEQERKMSLPRVLVERQNNLVRTINTSEEELQIEFYDSGTIDNDSISVYHNNELVISHGRLSLTPLIVRVKCNKTDNHHELVIVAENLGDIPPNTASMIIKGKSGKERHEIILESTEQRNAKVIINYVAKP